MLFPFLIDSTAIIFNKVLKYGEAHCVYFMLLFVVCDGGWVMDDETLVSGDHITINSTWSDGTEDVNDIRPKNQGEGKKIASL